MRFFHNMTSKAALPLVLLLTLIWDQSAAASGPDYNMDIIRRLGLNTFTAIINRDSTGIPPVLDSLRNAARTCGSAGMYEEELTARSYLGEYLLSTDNWAMAKPQLDTALALWRNIRDNADMDKLTDGNAVNKIFNSLAIYEVNYSVNYEKAVSLLIEGAETAERFGNESDYIVMASNLVIIDLIRNNPDGLKYALEVYRISKTQDDIFAKYSAAYGVALMEYVAGDYDLAEHYVLEALEYYKGLDADRLGAYNTYANILHAKGRDKEAAANYRKAMDRIESKSVTSALYTYLSYGKFLTETGSHREAVYILLKGIHLAEEKENKGFTYQLYETASKAYAALGDWKNAYIYGGKYHEMYNRVFDTKREWAINELTLKYETARKEQLLKENEIKLVKRGRALTALILVVALVLSVSGVIYYQYLNKNKMYKTIARQYSEAIRSQARAEESKYAVSSLADDKNKELFGSIEELMSTRHAYRDPELTREAVAEAIGTNRTYLSKAINDNTGKSFNQYIASYRLKEVIEKLSDPSDNTPLKAISMEAGFSSINTLYKLFKDEVGMPPAKYREKILELSKEQ